MIQVKSLLKDQIWGIEPKTMAHKKMSKKGLSFACRNCKFQNLKDFSKLNLTNTC